MKLIKRMVFFFCIDSIEKEMHKIGIAFDILKEDEIAPKNYTQVAYVILDVKIYFTRKARWVLDGRKIP